MATSEDVRAILKFRDNNVIGEIFDSFAIDFFEKTVNKKSFVEIFTNVLISDEQLRIYVILNPKLRHILLRRTVISK